MSGSVEIPQDIIDSIVAEVGDDRQAFAQTMLPRLLLIPFP